MQMSILTNENTFERHNCIDVTLEVISVTGTPRASAALNTLAPSRWMGMHCMKAYNVLNFQTSGWPSCNRHRPLCWQIIQHATCSLDFTLYLMLTANMTGFMQYFIWTKSSVDLAGQESWKSKFHSVFEDSLPDCQPTAWPFSCTQLTRLSLHTCSGCFQGTDRLFEGNAHHQACMRQQNSLYPLFAHACDTVCRQEIKEFPDLKDLVCLQRSTLT